MSLDAAVPDDRETALLAEIGQLREQLAAAEHASQKGAGRLRLLLDSAVDHAVVTTDLDGLVTLWSEGAQRTFGWTEADMLGQTVATFFTPEDRQAGVPQAEMRCALRDGRSADERWHQRKDGFRFWASGELTPLRDEAGAAQGFVKVLRDRTGQRNVAEKQRADAEFLRSILASSSDCIKVLDFDGKLAFMTEGGQRVMEVSDFNAIRGCPWTDFWHGEGNAAARAALKAAKAGGTGHFQGPANTMAGNPRYWDVQVTPILGADGRPERLLSVSRDITAMRDAERAVRESEARWHGLFERLREGLILGELVRDADGRTVDWRYLDVNPAWEEMVGIPREEAVGRTIREVIPGIEAEWVDETTMAKGTSTKAVPAKAKAAKPSKGNAAPAAMPAKPAEPHAAKPAAPVTVTLKHLAAGISEQHGLPKAQAEAVLAGVFEAVAARLKAGERVRIGGFGLIEVKDRPARIGRNPATGEVIQIAASRKLAFRVAKELKAAI